MFVALVCNGINPSLSLSKPSLVCVFMYMCARVCIYVCVHRLLQAVVQVARKSTSVEVLLLIKKKTYIPGTAILTKSRGS